MCIIFLYIISESDERITQKGLQTGHDYSILEMRIIKTKSGDDVQLLRLRSPMGLG